MAAVVLRCFFLLGFDIVMVVGRLCCCLSGCRRRSPVAAGESPAGFEEEERCLVTGAHYPLSGVRISPVWFNPIPGSPLFLFYFLAGWFSRVTC